MIPLPKLKHCRWCGKEFIVSPIMRNKAYTDYCSRLCGKKDAADWERTEAIKNEPEL